MQFYNLITLKGIVSFLILMPAFCFSQGVDFQQLSNGPSDAPYSQPYWDNGVLESNHAHYREDWSIPMRAVLSKMPIGEEVSITISLCIKFHGVYGLDYFTGDNMGDHSFLGHDAEAIDHLYGLTETYSDTDYHEIPSPEVRNSPLAGIPETRYDMLDADKKLMTIYNGDITNIQYVDVPDLGKGKNAYLKLKVTFKVLRPNVVIAFGAHVATRRDWGYVDGESRTGTDFKGIPYRANIDGWSLKKKCGNINCTAQPTVIIPAPPCDIVGPDVLCANLNGTDELPQYTVIAPPDPSITYLWTINNVGADAQIKGVNDSTVVTVNPGDSIGDFTISVAVNIGDSTYVCEVTDDVVNCAQIQQKSLTYASQNIQVLKASTNYATVNSKKSMISTMDDGSDLKVTVFPNPFDSEASINITFNNDSRLNVEIYSATGAKIRDIYNGVLLGGVSHQLNLNMNDLPKGMYFCVFNLNNGEERYVQKLLKL